jgi:two-component system, NtrC family, sensor kinase
VPGRRSIRRKMVTILGVVLLMLATLAVSGISGVYSYRGMVKDLELGLHGAPRRSDLVASISLLFQPLAEEFPEDAAESVRQRFAERQRMEFEEALGEVRTEIADFREKLQNMPQYAHRLSHEATVHHTLFEKTEEELGYLDDGTPALGDLQRHDAQVKYLVRLTAELIDTVNAIPDPSTELLGRLDQARNNYRFHLVLLWSTGFATLGMLLHLVRCSQRWILRPISNLHQGARRVADGDFDYRLAITTDDEMAELAFDFNRMTERFQNITADLDRQVQQRVKQLIRSERLAGVGFLAAGVAHEINNPLSAIAMAAESLEYRIADWFPDPDSTDAKELREDLRMMQTEAQRCRDITEKLLNFARGKEAERNLYDVTAIVREVINMTQHLGRFRDRTISVNRDSPCYAWVNGPEIKQVVLNLVANALESTDDDGRLEISIGECPDHVEIEFHDNGCGMTQKTIAHLFEPFYTTKEVGKGTGLGLSISQRIVRDHDGTLEADSNGPGKGSTFRLRLPAGPAAQRSAA